MELKEDDSERREVDFYCGARCGREETKPEKGKHQTCALNIKGEKEDERSLKSLEV